MDENQQYKTDEYEVDYRDDETVELVVPYTHTTVVLTKDQVRQVLEGFDQ